MKQDALEGPPPGAVAMDAIGASSDGDETTSPEENRKVLRWLIAYLLKHRALAAVVYALVFITAGTDFVVLPLTVLLMDSINLLTSSQAVFDQSLGHSIIGPFFVGKTPLHVVEQVAVIMVSAKLLSVLLSFLNHYLEDVLNGRILREMRADLFDHLLSMSDDYYHEHSTGELMTLFTQELNGALSIYMMVFFGPLISVLTLVYTAVFLLREDLTLGVLALLFAPIYYFVSGPLAQRISTRVSRVAARFSAINQDIQETLSAVREVKAHSAQDRERAEFGGNIKRHYTASLDYRRWQILAEQAMKFISEAAPVLILVTGALLIVHPLRSHSHPLTVGVLVVMIGSVTSLISHMSSLAGVGIAYQGALTFARRLFRMLQEPREAELLSGSKTLELPGSLDPKTPMIEFEGAHTTYPRSGYQVEGISFKVYPGQVVAIVGEGGAGKSTVFNLLFKLYPYDKGSVKLFGQELNDLSSASVRRAVGFLTQSPFFFQRSFKDNMLYGTDKQDGAAEARMKALCEEFGMDEVISALPGGYGAMITNRGANLSGSQQKRTALVRALIKDPPLLLLDEPLSGLSPEQRREVFDRIRQLAGRKTLLVITHDLDLIKNMDLILVFKRAERSLKDANIEGLEGLSDAEIAAMLPPELRYHGVLAEQGTYDELVARGGIFKNLLASATAPAEPSAAQRSEAKP